ncbi:MAG: DNA polymerase I [Candidatus Krumholzibacteriota bacterium]|nr:DNA polymerase I [Candidatus Krumholzibacteriota bacterium]
MKLLLVDGHALAYRSYFAMIRSPLTNRRGENTSAEFGFVRTLQALRRDEAPDAVLVCFDPVGKSFRHARYPEYKAQRPRMPAELKESVDRIQAFLDRAGVAWLRREGYEADDLMASAARRAAGDGWDVLLFTSDKDLCQIVDERVQVLRPATGARPATRLDAAAVEAEFGVPPARLLDYLSLVGDSADNLPGVPGLGPKGARKLLAQFAGLDEILSRRDEVDAPGARRRLAAGSESALLTRELARLVTDLDLAPPAAWQPTGGDPDALRDWLVDRGFQSMVDELVAGGPAPSASADYRLVADAAALADLAAVLADADRFAVDTETTGLDPLAADLVGISVATTSGRAWYVPVAQAPTAATLLDAPPPGLPLPDVRDALAPHLADPGKEKVAQNLKFDSQVLRRHGLPLAGPVFDTMLASYCVDPSRRSHGLDALALDHLGHSMIPYESLFAKGDRERDIRRVPMERLADYAAEDADFTLRLAGVLAPALAEAGVERVFREIEMPLVPVLERMEAAGLLLDRDHLAALSVRMADERDRLESRIWEAAGRQFAIASPRQLQVVLFEELGLPPGRRTKTGYSTDEGVLSELAAEHPIAGLVLEWRELSKLKNTYVDILPALADAAGRVHTRFNQAVATTGRLSSSDPNLQNIPVRTELGREIRRAFVAPPGGLLASFDYSQVELRILAHLSGDAALIEAFAAGRDIHRWTAARIAGKDEGDVTREERNRSKVVNYGVLYGMGAAGLAQRLRIGRAEAQAFIDEYFASFPGVRGWIEATLAAARKEEAVTTLLGRRRPLPDIGSSNGRVRSFAERVAVNTPIQGTAADLIKLAMIRVDARLRESGLAARLLLQVHDELLFECPAEERDRLAAAVTRIMEGVAELAVPLAVDWGAGRDWLEAH